MISTMVSFLINLLLVSAVSIQRVQISDTDGNPVKANEKYFIQPIQTESGNGGGLFPSHTNLRPSCPIGITQGLAPGLPVSFAFIWPYTRQTIVDTYSDVTIMFNVTIFGDCFDWYPKYWGVDVSSSTSKEPAIIVGAEPIKSNSWFQIRTAGENIYELATKSGTVGTIPEPRLGVPQLVLTNDTANTFFVKLKKLKVHATMATRAEKLGLRMFPFY